MRQAVNVKASRIGRIKHHAPRKRMSCEGMEEEDEELRAAASPPAAAPHTKRGAAGAAP